MDNDNDSIDAGQIVANDSDEEMNDESSDEEEDYDEETSVESDLDYETRFNRDLERIRDNDPRAKELFGNGRLAPFVQNITNEKWEEIGRDISNNTHLEKIDLCSGALDDHKLSVLFQQLTGSSSIKELRLGDNGLSAAGVREKLVQFLQNANNLRWLCMYRNNIQTEGFDALLRAFPHALIETLNFRDCGIESIDSLNTDCFKKLKWLCLSGNNINADGYRKIAVLLQGGNSMLEKLYLSNNQIDDEGVAILANGLRSNFTLTYLHLQDNKIGDEGVAVLVNALQGNTFLDSLYLGGNSGITKKGLVMMLKLVNDISSAEATIQSNHTLTSIEMESYYRVYGEEREESFERLMQLINAATFHNSQNRGYPEGAGREKMIETQLNSVNRAELAELQGVSQSVYSDINPLHLPEVLSLVGQMHGQGELYAALKSSIAGVISVVNRRACIHEQKKRHAALLAYHAAMLKKLDAELAKLDLTAGKDEAHVCDGFRSKRRRDV